VSSKKTYVFNILGDRKMKGLKLAAILVLGTLTFIPKAKAKSLLNQGGRIMSIRLVYSQ
jgi:hypothetical protein